MQEFGTGGVRGPPIHGSEQSSLRDSETVLDGVAYRVGAQATCGASDSLGMQRNLHHGCPRALVIIPLRSKGLYAYSILCVRSATPFGAENYTQACGAFPHYGNKANFGVR